MSQAASAGAQKPHSTTISASRCHSQRDAKAAIHIDAAHGLMWRMGGHTVAIRPRESAVSHLRDKDAGASPVRRVVALLTHAWDGRTEITPSIEMRQRLEPIEVYNTLPAMNCRACRQATCFTSELNTTVSQAEPEQCPLFFTDAYRDKRESG